MEEIYEVDKEPKILTEVKIIESVLDLDFVKYLKKDERHQLAILFKEQYKQGFINGSQLKK